MKFMTKSFWPLLTLLKNGAIYLKGSKYNYNIYGSQKS
jgi:hypothetical protein